MLETGRVVIFLETGPCRTLHGTSMNHMVEFIISEINIHRVNTCRSKVQYILDNRQMKIHVEVEHQ